MISQEFM